MCSSCGFEGCLCLDSTDDESLSFIAAPPNTPMDADDNLHCYESIPHISLASPKDRLQVTFEELDNFAFSFSHAAIAHLIRWSRIELRRTIDYYEHQLTLARTHPPPQPHFECVICQTRPKEYAFSHCGHLALCLHCVPTYPTNASGARQCPLCRKYSRAMQRIYY